MNKLRLFGFRDLTRHLTTAFLALLLLSASGCATDYVYSREMRVAKLSDNTKWIDRADGETLLTASKKLYLLGAQIDGENKRRAESGSAVSIENIDWYVWDEEKQGDASLLKDDEVPPPSFVSESTHPWDLAYALLLRDQGYGGNGTIVAAEPRYVDKADLATDVPQSIRPVAPDPVTRTDCQDLLDGIVPSDQTRIRAGVARVWPYEDDIAWHHADSYSQLRSARIIARRSIHNCRDLIRVVHMDTGYNRNDALLPMFFDHESARDFTSGRAVRGAEDNSPHGHGVRTLSSLAGGRARVARNDVVHQEFIGANPYMHVTEYKIRQKYPIHVTPNEMALAIFAAVDTYKADVISLSHGGLPSIFQRNAINHAYESGTAIFAATGDFIKIPLLITTPTLVVFPARYHRVMGVAGVTQSLENYADDPCFLLFCIFEPSKWSGFSSWFLRGSYGPESVMEGSVVSAFAPNITHSVPGERSTNRISLDGKGTSHSTPQVAGAASLWLQKNQDFLKSEGVWRTYRKTEAVFSAIIESAECKEIDGRRIDYSFRKMGEGILRAGDMMSVSYSSDEIAKMKMRPYSNIGTSWIRDLVDSTSVLPGYKREVLNLIQNMLSTELEQLLATRPRLAALFRRTSLCEERVREDGSICALDCSLDQAAVRKFVKKLRKAKTSQLMKMVVAGK